MRKYIFEFIRTTFFISGILTFSILIGVGVNELWNNNYAPIFPAIISIETLLSIFKVVGAITLTTMPVMLFGMATHSYSQRQTVADGETIVKMTMAFALILVGAPTVLFIIQGSYEKLAYFAAYWVIVVLLGNFGKYAPFQPAIVTCLERTANCMGMPK